MGSGYDLILAGWSGQGGVRQGEKLLGHVSWSSSPSPGQVEDDVCPDALRVETGR